MLPPPSPHALIPASSSERCRPTRSLKNTHRTPSWKRGACALAFAVSVHRQKALNQGMDADAMPETKQLLLLFRLLLGQLRPPCCLFCSQLGEIGHRRYQACVKRGALQLPSPKVQRKALVGFASQQVQPYPDRAVHRHNHSKLLRGRAPAQC